MIRKLSILAIILCIMCVGDSGVHFAHAQGMETGSIAVPSFVRARSYKAKRIRITWNRVTDADGYEIYQIKKNRNKKVAELESGKDRWLSPKTKSSQTYAVRAFKEQEGQKQYSDFSYTVSAKPYKKNDKKVNAGMIYAKRYQYKLGLYESASPEIVIQKSKYSKNKKAVVADTSLRWYSTDESIAVVDEKGVVHSKNKPGQCQVYARAHNGNYTKKMDINVYNYAYPSEFEYLETIQPEMEAFVKQYQEDMKAIAEYFELSNKTGNKVAGNFELSEDRMRIETRMSDREYAPVRQNIWNILSDYPGDLEIRTGRSTCFDLSSYPYRLFLTYLADYEPSGAEDRDFLAPRWYYAFWRIDI